MNIGIDNVFLLLVGSCTLGLLTALVLVRVSKK